MVMVVATMGWHNKAVPASTLGILAFDVGKTMSRLISLYHSFSNEEITKLRREVIPSKGISYLNSQQECFLLNLAAAERLEELDVVAEAVSRLSQKCSNLNLARFDLAYAELKLDIFDLRKLKYGTKKAQKIINKMEKLLSSTANLYATMESMGELETLEKKSQRWKTIGSTNNNYSNYYPKPSLEYFNEQIEMQRKQVKHYKQVSLWNQTFDKTVKMMAKVVYIIYARICSVFGAYITGIFDNHWYYCLLEHRELYQKNRYLSNQYEESLYKSGPTSKSKNSGPLLPLKQENFDFSRTSQVLFSSVIMQRSINDRDKFTPREDSNSKDNKTEKNRKVLRLASPSTVGGAGLSLRYANVIVLAERCLHASKTIREGAREELYEMLPGRLRGKVRAKLSGRWVNEEEGEGWREAVEELMEWLLPVARDTLRWQAERHFEKARFETKTTILLLQTLHYSDLEKAEAAIVEVLVGLSCIYWYERRR